MKFNDRPTTKKGELGEKIVKLYLEQKGWITYSPDQKDKAHYFDMLATKDKTQVIAIDVKTKARFNKWEAQGINLNHYNEYINFIDKTKVPFFLFFVDDKSGDVHCANLQKLKDKFFPVPKKDPKHQDIIAWYLKDMKKIFQLNETQIKELSQYDTRSYLYTPCN